MYEGIYPVSKTLALTTVVCFISIGSEYNKEFSSGSDESNVYLITSFPEVPDKDKPISPVKDPPSFENIIFVRLEP